MNILTTLFEEQVVKTPENTAIAEEQRNVTYGELNTRANQIAALLKNSGIETGSIVATFIPGSITLVEALIGIFKSGAVYLPLDITAPEIKLKQIVSLCHPRILITTDAYSASVKTFVTSNDLDISYVVVLSGDTGMEVIEYIGKQFVSRSMSYANFEGINQAPSFTAKDSNYIFFTSGSTGEPKGIVGSHEALSHFIRWEIQEFKITQADRVSQLVPVTFDASLRDIFVPLCSGAMLCIPDAKTRFNIPLLVKWISEHKITTMHCVPSLFRVITREIQSEVLKQPLSLKRILLAGEPLYRKDVENWRRVAGTDVELVNLYGTTEITLVKTFYRIGDIDQENIQHLIPVGRPIPNTVVAIINADGEICRIGELGDVYIKTPFWSKGYYNNTALTETVFVQNPLVKDRVDIVYKTGDLGRYLHSRDVEILGRADSQVKINGVRVELPEIQQHMIAMDGVEQVILMTNEDHDHQNILVAYYTGTAQDSDFFRTNLKQYLSDAVIPSCFVNMIEFPLNVNGKIDRKALPKPQSLFASEIVYQAPANEIERKLEKIWMAVLGLDKVSVTTSFFSVGGSSIKAIQVISRIYKDMEVLISIADFFANASIQKLARCIEKSAARRYDVIPLLPHHDYYDTSHSQQRLWIVNQFSEARSAYTIHLGFMLEGILDVQAFENAFRALIIRHETLRTSFHFVDGIVKQKIHDFNASTFTLQYINTSGKEGENNDIILDRLIAEQADLTFDLDQVPLFNVKLIHVGNAHVFLFSLHHIIGDDWSMGVLVRELSTLYNGYLIGAAANLSPLSIQYKEYASWVNNTVLCDSSEHKIYWTTLLSGTLPTLNLPFDFSRPKQKSYAGDCLVFSLSIDESKALKTIGVEHSASTFMTLLTCVKLLLFDLTGNDDLIVGTTVAGRDAAELEDQVGFYVNTLALRTQLNASDTFVSTLEKVKQNVLAAYQHQIYPFDKLIADLGLVRDASTTPIFNVLVELLNADGAGPIIYKLNGIRIEPIHKNRQTTQYDLSFRMQESENGIQIFLEYNKSLFRKKTVHAIASGMQMVVTKILSDNHVEISSLEIFQRRKHSSKVAIGDSFDLKF